MIIQVALPGPFLTALDYGVEPNFQTEKLQPGVRVCVPFRRQTKIGLLLAVDVKPDCDPDKLKLLIEVLDDQPLFSERELAFLNWAAHYYHEPIGEVVMAALPKRLRAGEPLALPGLLSWQRSAMGREISLDQLPKNAPKQRALWQALSNNQAWSSSQLNQQFDAWRPLIKRWVSQGWLEEREGSCLSHNELADKPGHQLNAEQQAAVDQVLAQQAQFAAFLLQGVTGSGKTEVYLAMIEAVLAQGKQALVLVPEIGLTPQTAQRFESYLQKPVVALHSGLNDQERHCAWQLVRSGEIQVLLGTRSALFTPFANLGLCVIDEEHDLSFKQQDGFRYSARDLLVRRAQMSNVPVVLGSATPSLESLYNVEQGRYQHLTLTQRAGSAQMPSIRLLDIRGERLNEGVSTPLKTAMEKHLAAGNQVLLFLNRRGYAPVLMCHDCGWQADCPSCDANLTYHQAWHELRCHHCGFSQKAPLVCPKCQSKEFVNVGQGTERLEQVIQSWFADKQVLRIDRDTTRRKGSLADKVEQARSGEADILIGTQMLAKGHHFPKVTLVGLIDLDQGLFSVDYRAAERMAQLIVQVAGRAGRADRKGEVLIQTHHPEHPLLRSLVAEGYSAFAKDALAEREAAQLPPYGFQILVRAESFDPQHALDFLAQIKQVLLEVRVEAPCEVWGPVSAPMERRQGRYRYQLLLQSQHRRSLQAWLSQVEADIYRLPLVSKVRWSLDIDPQELR
ncbi:primosomal protein N' [Thiomicrospira microaerophila]|uniref:primosomal protein N' n=1 Tax=Thiomicrospira microaerophila TaxID=406020 RepID=UPI00201044A0|nr:primosomal protein N' [Thiomicrospira microaerophila]UQB41921.1 primosomal protein N' [Thiomicrospira microaerophila]